MKSYDVNVGVNLKFGTLYTMPPTHPHCKCESQKEGTLLELFTVSKGSSIASQEWWYLDLPMQRGDDVCLWFTPFLK